MLMWQLLHTQAHNVQPSYIDHTHFDHTHYVSLSTHSCCP